MNETLKPCPFCGGNAIFSQTEMAGLYSIECEKCGARTDYHYNFNNVIENWNRREIVNGNVNVTIRPQDLFQILHLWEALQGIEGNRVFTDANELLKLRTVLSYVKNILDKAIKEIRQLLLSQEAPVSSTEKD